MRILYVSQYYPPEMGAPSARVSELARAWAASGHEVTVLTAFPHHPHGVKQPEDEGVLTRVEKDGAVRVVRTYVYAARNSGFLPRIVSYLSFMVSAVLIGSFQVGRQDVVIATSPQLFTVVAGWVLSRLRRVPFVFEVRDLWPESIVQVGAMREGIGIRLLKRLAHRLYLAADRIVTVGPGYSRGIVANYAVPPEKISVVTNGVDLKLFRENPSARRTWREEHRVPPDTSIVLYLGTHGMAHGLGCILDAAESLRDRKDIQFLFVGDGAEKPRLEQAARARELSNVRFLPPQAKEQVVELYSASDFCLIPLRKRDLFKEVLPSKLFEIMSMGRPSILSVDGDARAILERADAGIFVEPESVDGFREAILTLHGDPKRRLQMGNNGRGYVEAHYSREVLAGIYLRLLEDMVREGSRSARFGLRTEEPLAPVRAG